MHAVFQKQCSWLWWDGPAENRLRDVSKAARGKEDGTLGNRTDQPELQSAFERRE